MSRKSGDQVIVPSWLESHRALQRGRATPLQRFVALNEPASGALRDDFRAHLAAALAHALARRRPVARRAGAGALGRAEPSCRSGTGS